MEPKPSAFYTITFSSTLIKNKMFFVCSIYIYVVFTYSNVTVYQYVSEKYTIQYNTSHYIFLFHGNSCYMESTYNNYVH